MHKLLLGTSNPGKLVELRDLFASTEWEILSLADFATPPDVAETGATLAANAALKAQAYARHSGLWTLADDTALEVDALGGGPGIYTARYAGPQATSADNRRRLLDELSGVPLERRQARFVCELCLVDPSGTVRQTTTGVCRGRIRQAESGAGGFGYDALFEVIEYHQTFGQLGPAAKAILSHRARAAGPMLGVLANLAAGIR